jgi:hypothetical protein
MKKLILILALIIFSCNQPKEIHFTMHDGLPVISANVNGLPVKLLIDTGANLSLIDTSTDMFLFFERDFEIPVTMAAGLGGNGYIFGIKNIEIEYEGRVLDVNFRGTNLSNFRKNNGIVGIIGSDYLNKHGLVIDYYNRTIKEGEIDKF